MVCKYDARLVRVYGRNWHKTSQGFMWTSLMPGSANLTLRPMNQPLKVSKILVCPVQFHETIYHKRNPSNCILWKLKISKIVCGIFYTSNVLVCTAWLWQVTKNCLLNSDFYYNNKCCESFDISVYYTRSYNLIRSYYKLEKS